MKLNFPNPCRSFDASGNRVRFWGYDSSIEVSFFVETAALQRLCPEMDGLETGILNAFDSALDKIHVAADRIYVRGARRSNAYVLAVKDF